MTLNSMIAKVVSEDLYDWDIYLPTILAASRASRHESTGFSPNFIVFGKENRAPIDIVILSPPTFDDSSVAGVDEYTERERERYTRAYDMVRENLSEAAQRQKEYYDTRVKTV